MPGLESASGPRQTGVNASLVFPADGCKSNHHAYAWQHGKRIKVPKSRKPTHETNVNVVVPPRKTLVMLCAGAATLKMQ